MIYLPGSRRVDNLANIPANLDAVDMRQVVMHLPEALTHDMTNVADNHFSDALGDDGLHALVARNPSNVDATALETGPRCLIAGVLLSMTDELVLVTALSGIRQEVVGRVRKEPIASRRDDMMVLINDDSAVLSIRVMRTCSSDIGLRHEDLIFAPSLVVLISELWSNA